ncbi:FkbM family methyltransferase [Chloroflexota bacterium]
MVSSLSINSKRSIRNSLKYLMKAAKFLIYSLICRVIWGRFTDSLTVRTKDDIKFILHFPEDKGWEYIYHHQSFETGTTDLLRLILRPDDAVFDIGANFGWYTVFFNRMVAQGQCHAFEPVPWIYDKLKANCALNNVGDNTFLNQLALGNTRKVVKLYTFSGECHGLSSISSQGKESFITSEAQMITVNQYLKENKVDKLNFIKCDVEGAELEVLEGATALFSQHVPPMWLFEANEETSAAFGHRPSDVLAVLQNTCPYKFYRIKGSWGKFLPMETIHDYEHGDNILCMIPEFHSGRMPKV